MNTKNLNKKCLMAYSVVMFWYWKLTALKYLGKQTSCFEAMLVTSDFDYG